MRYLIVDLESDSAKECHVLGVILANYHMPMEFDHFLSDEQSTEVLKKVWDAGFEQGLFSVPVRKDRKPPEKMRVEDFIKTL